MTEVLNIGGKTTMKVALLVGQCTAQYLIDSMSVVTKVLKELDVETEIVQLCQLPYFMGEKTEEMNQLVKTIEASKGVIAITHVPMLSMHGAVQTFFDCATAYNAEHFDKPILAITYSEWLGEGEAAEKILKNWSIIGGAEGYKIGLSKNMEFNQVASRLERLTEDFYRLIKQERQNIASTERQLYNYFKRGQPLEALSHPMEQKSLTDEKEFVSHKIQGKIKSFVDILKEDSKFQEPKTSQDSLSINLSTKEQTIKEITHLLKKQVSEDGAEQPFTAMQSGIYTRPPIRAYNMHQSNVKKLQQIPHYFIAKHDKSLDMILKYTLTNLDEEGYIIIKEGDCEYVEHTDDQTTVEFILSEATLAEIMTKKTTYQKAFMLGKLKVKGNFAVLPKLDQAFASA